MSVSKTIFETLIPISWIGSSPFTIAGSRIYGVRTERKMKHLLLTTIAAVLLVGCAGASSDQTIYNLLWKNDLSGNWIINHGCRRDQLWCGLLWERVSLIPKSIRQRFFCSLSPWTKFSFALNTINLTPWFWVFCSTAAMLLHIYLFSFAFWTYKIWSIYFPIVPMLKSKKGNNET